MKKPELLAPAGSLEKLKIAVLYGADAIFIGGQEFGLRSNTNNFSILEIKEAAEFVHKYDKKLYITTNIFCHDENIEGLDEYILELKDANVDGIIVADPVIFMRVKELAPNIELHLSTQQSVTNYQSVNYFNRLGIKRVVLARELSELEIKDIIDKTNTEIEVFIHGAQCVSYSGHCTMSNHFTARDSNRGGCSQSCRWEFDLYQDTEKLSIEGDPFMMSPKDLNLVSQINRLMEIGVDSLKIEGRMRSIHYVATTVSTYRKIIDDIYDKKVDFSDLSKYVDELRKCQNREVAESFFVSNPNYEEQLFGSRIEYPTQEFVGIVIDFDEEIMEATIEQRNHFKVNDELEIFGPNINTSSFIVPEIINKNGESVDAARHPQEIIKIKVPFKISINDMLRKKR